jgi:DNA-binding response OmpR family regulator
LKNNKLTGQEINIVNILKRNAPRPTRPQEIFNELYKSRGDGGPISDYKIIHVYIWRLRKKKVAIGHTYGQGYFLIGE